jgi:hypothetical protein
MRALTLTLTSAVTTRAALVVALLFGTTALVTLTSVTAVTYQL